MVDAESIERYFLWPFFDFVTSLSMLYLFYCQGMKSISDRRGSESRLMSKLKNENSEQKAILISSSNSLTVEAASTKVGEPPVMPSTRSRIDGTEKNLSIQR